MTKEKSAKSGRRIARGITPAPTINNILAVTCPVCQQGNGALCDTAYGGTYAQTSRGLIHPERFRAAGLTVTELEIVGPYVAPGTATPATASVSFAPAIQFANNDRVQIPDGTGGVVIFEAQIDGTFTPSGPSVVTVDLRPIYPSGTADNVRSLFEAAFTANMALGASSSSAGVELLSWPILGTVGNGQALVVLVEVPPSIVATNFAGGVGTSTLAFARGSITVNAPKASFTNHDTITLQTDAGPVVLEFEAVALGYVPTPGDVQVDVSDVGVVTAADVLAAIDDALFNNTDFFLDPAGAVEALTWPVPGAAGNGNSIAAVTTTPAILTTVSFAGGSD